jgi:hypothetical protein
MEYIESIELYDLMYDDGHSRNFTLETKLYIIQNVFRLT